MKRVLAAGAVAVGLLSAGGCTPQSCSRAGDVKVNQGQAYECRGEPGRTVWTRR